MRRFAFAFSPISTALIFIACASCLCAQTLATSRCPDNESDRPGIVHWLPGQEHACEIRSGLLPLNGLLRVKGENGGIEVIGEDRQDIALETRVETHAQSQAQAESLLREIHVHTAGIITAEGPRPVDLDGWSVGFRLRVPRRLAAELETGNGSIRLSSLEGDIHARTQNGSLSLRDLAGDVHATTTNGGAKVTLAGGTWRGRGLSVQSTNGALAINLPGSYSAHLVAQTTNGGISGDPSLRAEGRHHTTLDTNVGEGGPTLDFTTTNGHIAFSRN